MSSCTDMSAVVEARRPLSSRSTPIPTPTETAIPWLLQSELSPEFPTLTELAFPIPNVTPSPDETHPATPYPRRSAPRSGALAAALLFLGLGVGVVTAHAATDAAALLSHNGASRSSGFPEPAYLARSADEEPAAHFEMVDESTADKSSSAGPMTAAARATGADRAARAQRVRSRKADAPARRATAGTLAALLDTDAPAHAKRR